MKHTIACRPSCLELPLPEALAALKSLGLDNAEVTATGDEDYAALARTAAEAGVTLTSLSTGVGLDDPARVVALERIIAGAAQIGTPVIFVSCGVGEGTYEQGLKVLRALAEKAYAAGVVLSIETHVPFAHTGEAARKTIEAVNSPGIGWNFDSGNIYYYNPRGFDAVEELQKALPYVTSVHLKDSAHGEPESMEFTVFGQGIVNFPEVFRLLDGRGFTGPYTMELEGPLVGGLPTEARLAIVQGCLDYLKEMGARV